MILLTTITILLFCLLLLSVLEYMETGGNKQIKDLFYFRGFIVASIILIALSI